MHSPTPSLRCDCHVHVFDPARFPYAAKRSYTPGPAPLDALLSFQARLGMGRTVLVQPSAYGDDNRALLDALAGMAQAFGGDRARGVAVVDLTAAKPEDLQALHTQGVRGIRLNLEVQGLHDPVAAVALVHQAEQAVAPLGWSLQLHAPLPLVAALAPQLAALRIPVVLDHFAGAKTWQSTEQEADLGALLQWLRSGNVYIKLSAPYRVSRQADYADVAALARTLIAAAPHRMLWGSDWPHTGSSATRTGDLSQIEPFRREDAARTLGLLGDWAPDTATRQQILVSNPAQLYGFATA